jgi:hypothetical protein
MSLVTMLALAACSSDTIAAGSERGPCYGNGTCDVPLVCFSNLCVRDVALDAGADAGLDAEVPTDAGGDDLGTDAGPLERRTYVVSQLTLPTQAGDSTTYGLDLDGDGMPDNALAQMLNTLTGAGLQLQQAEDGAITEGSAILLVEASASSFAGGAAQARALRGGDPTPPACTTPGDPLSCGQHLSGAAHFTVTPPVPEVMSGTITSGALEVGPGASMVPIAFLTTPVWLPLVAARARAQLDATGLTSGVLAGGVRQSDVDTLLIPAFYGAILNTINNDCGTSGCMAGSVGASMVTLFDANHDGGVMLEEFQASSLVQTLLAPDLDLFDAAGAPGTDGVLDSLSVGVGFTTVGAVFTAP